MSTLIELIIPDGEKHDCNRYCYDGFVEKGRCICGGVNWGVGYEQAMKNVPDIFFDLLRQGVKVRVTEDVKKYFRCHLQMSLFSVP
jgi:hypothetical protein